MKIDSLRETLAGLAFYLRQDIASLKNLPMVEFRAYDAITPMFYKKPEGK